MWALRSNQLAGYSSQRLRRETHGATRKAPRKTQAKLSWMAAIQQSLSAWLNRGLVLVAATVVIVLGTQAYLKLVSIPVERVSVTGSLQHTQTEAVQKMVQPALQGGFLNADLTVLREQLEALPWIYEATVRRRWPNALEIHVVEQLPIARWGEDGFLNHEAVVFQTTREGNWDALPLLRGEQSEAHILMARYQRLEELLQPLSLQVSELSIDERGQLDAVLEGGTQLKLGNEEFVERVQRFVAVYQAELGERSEELERVDMRYKTGMAVVFTAPVQIADLSITNKKGE
ncbi:cell division protein FtsQ/DivIB [Marinobacter alexandrii]|uniref:cell division protein FtsQ/DivIB n=1 Tax=Marinobacter alexandrii TaxID=2570351 RepID=UPI0032971BC1